MSYGFFQDDNGDWSMARLLAFVAQMTGSAAVVAAVGLIVVAFFTERSSVIGQLVSLAVAGFGVDVAGLAMKNWSKGAEARLAAARGQGEGR